MAGTSEKGSLFAGLAAVTFDGDGTLWDFESSMRAALAKTAEELAAAGLRRDGGPVEASWLAEVRAEIAALPEYRSADMRTIRLAAFTEAIRRCDPARVEMAGAVCEAYFEHRFEVLRPYPDVAAALPALHERFPLALVTNGNTHPSHLGFEDRFEVVLFAFEHELAKPDPGIYLLAAERLGVEPSACLHVGDHPDEDVEAARRAGMQTVWINRERRRWPADLEPADAELPDLSGLPALLANGESV